MANKKKPGRGVHGILLLNKSLGKSSNWALQGVKRLYQANKAGHTGSLDPLATGMLPVCFGEATKFSHYLFDASKRYTVVAKLGETTTTGDSEGEILSTKPVPPLTETDILATLKKFIGTQSQLPPMYSALKHQGQPLYKLARKGIEIERKPREITIKDIELTEYTPDTLTLDVACSKGTYIRSLVADIGEAIGCGAHVIKLHRTEVAHFKTQQMLSFADLQQFADPNDFTQLDQKLLPVSSAVNGLASQELSEQESTKLLQGQPVQLAEFTASDLIQLHSSSGSFLGIGAINHLGIIKPKRLISYGLFLQGGLK